MPPFAADAVVVCGAGAAGIATALAAARAGATVVLVESRPSVGGTVAHTLLHTLGGLYDSAGQLLNRGLPGELIDRLERSSRQVCKRRMGQVWVLQVCPSVYVRTVRDWLAEETRITVCVNAQVQSVACADQRIAELHIRNGATVERIHPGAVVDATGTAEVVRLVNSTLVEDDAPRALGGFVARLRGLAPDSLVFPRGVGIARQMRAAAASGELPSECSQAWLDIGVAADEAYLKLAVPIPDDWRERQSDLAESAHRHAGAVVEFLRKLWGFENIRLECCGELGIRDGGRAVGEYRLTVEDVRQARKCSLSAGRCAWPIEYWDPVAGLRMEHLPEGQHYDIPLAALKVRDVANLWVAGKCLSADRLAQASARVVGSCWAMGEAAGYAAARGASSHGT